MSDAEFEKITNRAGSGAPNFTYGLNSGGSDSGLLGFAYTASGTEPSSPANGDVWFDTANDKYYTYINGEFKQLTHVNAITTPAWGGNRGLFLGGSETSNYNDIDYFDIQTTGNSSTFGDLTGHSEYASAAGNGTRVLHAHGYNGSSEPNSVDYITSATTGNASDFGNLTAANRAGLGSCGDGTYVIFYGGGIFSGKTNVIDYFTAATTGNATDFGDDTQSRGSGIGGCSSETRGLFGGGSFTGSPYYTNQISYITIASTGNAADFGDLTLARNGLCAMSDNTYGVWSGGYASNSDGGRSNVMDYVTIDTLSNAQDFGDLLAVNNYVAACSNGTYGVIGGGYASGTTTNTLQYVTIATTANAADFGDLTKVFRASGSASGADA